MSRFTVAAQLYDVIIGASLSEPVPIAGGAHGSIQSTFARVDHVFPEES